MALSWRFATAVCKYVVGPIVAAVLAGGYAAQNHAQSAKGYEVVAASLNLAQAHLDALEKRVDALEKVPPPVAPATQPTIRIERLIMRAPAKAAPRALLPAQLREVGR